jgi:peptide/nickel transport system substrate-binding protein
MTTPGSQDTGPGRWLRLVGIAAAAAAVVVGAAGCESPARVKPWRHAADPTDEASRAPRSPALAADDPATAVHAARAHTLRIAMDAEPRQLNPLTSPSTWTLRATMGTVFETLIRYQRTPGGNGYASGLARAWKVSSGGTEIKLELEPDVVFHDGRSLSSVDVQFTLDLIRDPRSGIDHLRWMLAAVDAVELVTSREVRLRLSRPDGWVLRALASIPILPMHVYQGSVSGSGSGPGGAVVGTGPWKLVAWKDGVIHLGAWDRYRGGPPAIADVELVALPDAAKALTLAKRGEIDIVPELIPAHWPEQASAPGIATSFVPLVLAPPRLRYIVFDASTPPTDDARVRQALGLLVDRRELARVAYDGLARPIAGPVWPGGPIDGAELEAPPFDPAAAGKLLDAAGWRDSNHDGVRDRDGAQLRLSVLVVERDAKDIPGAGKGVPERDPVLDAWKRAGIGVDVRAGTEAVLMNRLRDGEFDAAFVEWGGAADLDMSPQLASGRADNLARIGSRRLDHALAALGEVWDPAERTRLGAEVAAAFAEAMPWAPIVAVAPQGLVHRRVKGVTVWDGWIDLTRLALAPAP